MDSRTAFLSLLADAASAELAIPLACPTEIADGRYRLDELIDSGRRAWVYRATDRRLSSAAYDATVIIKVFKATDLNEQESLIARRVEHPNIIGVIDRGRTEEGHPFVVMAYAKGGDLGRVAVPMPPRQAATLIAKVADAAHCLHTSGIVHCDIKPANILLSETGEPMLADFELAASPISDSVTFRGTLAFMSPEQRSGAENALGPLTDVYGLGAVLHLLLTGSPPDGPGSGPKPPLHQAPAPLLAICQRALHFDRQLRHASASELATDLRAWLGHEPIAWQEPSTLVRTKLWMRRRPAMAVAIIAGLVTMVAGVTSAFVWTAKEKERELASKNKALAMADAKIKELQEQGQATIKGLFDVLGLKTRSATEEMMPVMVWLDWLGTTSLVDEKGGILAANERINTLNQLLMNTDKERPRSIESLVLRVALAELEMRDRRSKDALNRIREARELWLDRLEPTDPVRSTLRAIEVCAQVDLGTLAGSQALTELEAATALSGLRPRLLDAVERRLSRLQASQRSPATPTDAAR